MSGFFYSIMDTMASIGLGNPISRSVSLACIGFGAQYFIKPSISYARVPSKGGDKFIAKEFAPTSKASGAMTTWFPWYMFPVVLAVIGGLFI